MRLGITIGSALGMCIVLLALAAAAADVFEFPVYPECVDCVWQLLVLPTPALKLIHRECEWCKAADGGTVPALRYSLPKVCRLCIAAEGACFYASFETQSRRLCIAAGGSSSSTTPALKHSPTSVQIVYCSGWCYCSFETQSDVSG